MERIELDFDGDVTDAAAAVESMTRILERLEKTAWQAGKATDSIDVDLADDIAQVELLDRKIASLNRTARAASGMTFLPGGAGGGGQWAPSGATYAPTSGGAIQGPGLNQAFASAAQAAANNPSTRRSWTQMFTASLGAALRGAGGGGGAGGGSVGGFFGYGANDGRLQAGDIVRGILPGAGRAGPGALGMLGAGAAGLGALLAPGAFAGLAAGGALITSLIASVAVATVAFAGMGKAIEGDKEAFDKLTPSAQKFVNQIREIIPWAKELRVEIQDRMLPGVAAGFAAITSPAMLGALKTGLGAIATEVGNSVARIGEAFGSADFAGKLGKFLQDSTGWTRNLTTAFIELARAAVTVLAAVDPLLDWMTEGIAKGAQMARMWIDNRVESGKFATDMDRMKDSIRIVGDALGSVIGFLVSLGDVMSQPVANALELVGDALDELARTLEENKQEIRNFVNGALAALASIIGTIWPMVKRLAGALNEAAEAIGGWDNAWKAIGWALIIGKLATLVTSLALVGTTAGAAAGAAGTGGLLSNLLKLGGIGPIPVMISVGIVGGALALKFLGKWLGENIVDKIDGGGTPGKFVPGKGWVADDGINWDDPVAAPTPRGSMGTTPRGPGGRQTRGQGPGQSAGDAIAAPDSWTPAAHDGPSHDTSGMPAAWDATNTGAIDLFGVFAVPDQIVGAPVSGTLIYYHVDGAGAPGGDSLQFKGDDGYTYFMAHLSRKIKANYAKVGQHVEKGTPLGAIADVKGAHLHIDKAGTIALEAAGQTGTGDWTGGDSTATTKAPTSANTAATDLVVTALKTEMAHIAKIVPQGLDELEPGLKKRLDAARALMKKLSADGLFSEADAAKVTAALKNLSRDAENSLDMAELGKKILKAKKDIPELLAGGFITPAQAKELTAGFNELAKMKKQFMDPDSDGGIYITDKEEAKYRAAATKFVGTVTKANTDLALAAAGIKVARDVLKDGLKDGMLTDAELDAVESKMQGLKGRLAEGIRGAIDAVQIDRTAFRKAFDDFVGYALKAFDKAHEVMFAALQASVTFEGLTFSFGAGDMTPAEKELADRAAAREKQQITDRVASAKKILDDARQKEGESQDEWNARRAELQGDYNEALYDQQTYYLGLLATGQRKAAEEALGIIQTEEKEKTEAKRIAFEAALRKIGEDMALNKIAYGDGLEKIKALFGEYEVPFGEQSGILGEALKNGLVGAFGKLTTAIEALASSMETLLSRMGVMAGDANRLTAEALANYNKLATAAQKPYIDPATGGFYEPGKGPNFPRSGDNPSGYLVTPGTPSQTLQANPALNAFNNAEQMGGDTGQGQYYTPIPFDPNGGGGFFAGGGLIDQRMHGIMGEAGPEVVLPIPPELAAILKSRFGSGDISLGRFLDTVMSGRRGRGVPGFYGSGITGGGGGTSVSALISQLRAAQGGGGGGSAGDTHVNVSLASGMEWLEEFVKVQVRNSTREISYEIGRESSRRLRGGRLNIGAGGR